MDTNQEPIDTIQAWQDWYKAQRSVPSFDKRAEPKNNQQKENNTSNSADQLLDEIEQMSFKKATEYFADTLSEFRSDLSARQLFEALLAAATDNYNHSKNEYDKAKQFLDLLNGENKNS